jgi:hypothetical protein
MFSLPLSLRSEPKYERVCVASRRGSEANAPLAQHRGSALRNAAFGQAGTRRLAGAVHRTIATSRSFGFFMSVVGASRRSAAPGSQFVGAAGYGSVVLLAVEVGAVGNTQARPYRPASSVACQRAMPNPSIERTRPGKPGRASHVKR